MSNVRTKQKAILKELGKRNKVAREYLKARSFNYKQAYSALQKTQTWINAKVLLIEYFSLTNEPLECHFCGAKLNPYLSSMHHDTYDQKKLFHPKYISFLHYDCHQVHHRENGILTKKHVKVYFGNRRIKIYSPRIGKINLRYELLVLIVLLFVVMFGYLRSLR